MHLLSYTFILYSCITPLSAEQQINQQNYLRHSQITDSQVTDQQRKQQQQQQQQHRILNLPWFRTVDPRSIVLKHDEGIREAYEQSYGFFYDFPNDEWHKALDIVKRRRANQHRPGTALRTNKHGTFYNENWESEFSCPFEKRIGDDGDGGKWVCDPHRIKHLSGIRKTDDNRKDPCLIYSVGSAGKDDFERAIMDEIGEDECEIHTFEVRSREEMVIPEKNEDEQRKSNKIHFHYNWGIVPSDAEPTPGFKSLRQTIEELGHVGRTIDLFKIDCEGCEWKTFNDWINAPALILQILTEIHNVPDESDAFFHSLGDAGYVIFHKEPNIISGQRCVEYSFLKLHPEALASDYQHEESQNLIKH